MVYNDLQGLEGFIVVIWCCVMLFGLFVIALITWAMCKICSKTGYSWALGLLTLVWPLGLLVLIFVLGFGTWPIHREMQTLREQNSIQSIR
ncbi:MAG: hypothetical protein ACYSSP_01025 [Planctomycetota bacterium]|jgi:hypothetical protein